MNGIGIKCNQMKIVAHGQRSIYFVDSFVRKEIKARLSFFGVFFLSVQIGILCF